METDNGAWMREPEQFWQAIGRLDGHRTDYGGRHTIKLKRRNQAISPSGPPCPCGAKATHYQEVEEHYRIDFDNPLSKRKTRKQAYHVCFTCRRRAPAARQH